MNTHSNMLAINVNEILSRYIVIHDQIVKFPVRRLLPIPGLFKAIPYCTHEQDLAALLGEVAAVDDRISEHHIGLPEAAQTEREFIEVLAQYATALSDTISQLHNISAELCLKSRGEGHYPYRRYRANLDSYEESVEHYLRIGQRLNVLHRRMVENPS